MSGAKPAGRYIELRAPGSALIFGALLCFGGGGFLLIRGGAALGGMQVEELGIMAEPAFLVVAALFLLAGLLAVSSTRTVRIYEGGTIEFRRRFLFFRHSWRFAPESYFSLVEETNSRDGVASADEHYFYLTMVLNSGRKRRLATCGSRAELNDLRRRIENEVGVEIVHKRWGGVPTI